MPVSLINNIYWWSGAARKCTFRPRRPSKYAGSGAGSAGFRTSLNQHECEFRPRGALKSGRVPSGFRRVPNSADQQYREFRSRGVAKSGRAPSGFRRVPAAITINVVLSLCVQMRLPAPRSLCLLAPPSSSWGPTPRIFKTQEPKILTWTRTCLTQAGAGCKLIFDFGSFGGSALPLRLGAPRPKNYN